MVVRVPDNGDEIKSKSKPRDRIPWCKMQTKERPKARAGVAVVKEHPADARDKCPRETAEETQAEDI